MKSFAYYRLPYADTYTKVTSEGAPLVIDRIEDIGKQQGFVIVPFNATDETPIILIPVRKIETHHVCNENLRKAVTQEVFTKVDEAYRSAFSVFHDNVICKRFRKLVLARTHRVHCSCDSQEALFLELCKRYPRLMIMLFSTPLTGTWIISSPEILIEGTIDKSSNHSYYHTMALAGTMPYKDGLAEWSEKNKGEQHVVEKYIEDIITPLSSQIVKDGPYTSRAGDIVHLRTDFRFYLKEGTDLGEVIKSLHPTPAVCGLPRKEAMQFIIDNEGIDRRYYSGFAGPVGINEETHLYVSLRCAELHDGSATLYAGGGIMPDSQCDSEWHETELKMQTIKSSLELL